MDFIILPCVYPLNPSSKCELVPKHQTHDANILVYARQVNSPEQVLTILTIPIPLILDTFQGNVLVPIL